MLGLEKNESSRSTRDRVLHSLLMHQKCTINEIADEVEINPISVRHHITKLQADGLVISAEERHGVGRPRRIYFLTDYGREQFPTRYLRLTLRLLEQLKETVPPELVSRLFVQMAEDLTADYAAELEELTIEEKLELIKKILESEGFSVDWERFGDQYQIKEINCPYFHLGQNHPEICSLDQTLISNVLSIPVEKIQCMLNGDAHCTYVIPAAAIVENKS